MSGTRLSEATKSEQPRPKAKREPLKSLNMWRGEKRRVMLLVDNKDRENSSNCKKILFISRKIKSCQDHKWKHRNIHGSIVNSKYLSHIGDANTK